MVGKALRSGYYWPTLQKDAYDLVKACDQCQHFANVQTRPSEPMTPITAPRAFAQWGIDIMGPLLKGRKQYNFFIVTINYFTKWVKVEPTGMITEAKITSFIWKNVVYRFDIPNVIISDNGKQFNNPKFQKICQDLSIKNHYSSPRHPQANDQTKVTNRSLLKIIKTQLEGVKGAWPEKPPNVLWAYRTTTRVPTGETRFRLTFGTEAIIPVKIGLTNIRVKAYEE